jgi:steroid delta-isomerase-like uncharacterized protein
MGDEQQLEQNKAIVRRLLEECLGRGELDRLDALVAADYRQRDTTLPSGRDALKEFFAGFRTAFPDLSVRVEDLVAEGDRVAAVTVSRATQRGTFSGLPPTGRHVEFRSMDLYRLADGQIVEHYGRIDELGLLEQLGVKHDLQWPGEPAPSTPRV